MVYIYFFNFKVADDPLTLNAAKAMNQVSNIAYTGKGSAVSKSYVSTRAAKRLAGLKIYPALTKLILLCT